MLAPPTKQRGRAPDGGEAAYLVPLLSRRQRVEHTISTGLWLCGLVYFWVWWLQPEHNIGNVRLTLVSVVLAWMTLLPLYFIAIVGKGKTPSSSLQIPAGSRVAMVVTKAPSEPFPVVARTLEAMLRQTCPHDTWLADEDPSAETLAWCSARGVGVSTRKGRLDYHRPEWPRRTRCKEGNLAFFYDHYGYRDYDFVAQLDADHVPTETYLEEILKPFADPRVGYVSAPSICDKNAEESWSARSRLYVEACMHGALQAGYNDGWAPLCIGSHYAVRTAALRDIGGLGPELAEDHSTTLLMNAHGWRGVHAIHAIAHGDGPRTFADFAVQEFQWSRSLGMILLQYTRGCLPALSWKLKFQFLFCQLWYPLFSIMMLSMLAMPIWAVAFDFNFVDVSYLEFIKHIAPMSVVLSFMVYRCKQWGWLRPVDARALSWEAALYQFARWPWSLAGSIAALRDWATGSVVEFRVTPKGSHPAAPLPFRVLAPYTALSLLSILPVLLSDVKSASGFYVFAIINAAIYAGLVMVILTRHSRENGLAPAGLPGGLALRNACLVLALGSLPLAAGWLRGAQGVEALTWGTERFRVTTASYSIVGAGQGSEAVRKVRFLADWPRQSTAAASGQLELRKTIIE